MHIYSSAAPSLLASPLSGELQRLLGPVTYTNGKQEELAFEPLVAKSPYLEGKALYLKMLGIQTAPVMGSP